MVKRGVVVVSDNQLRLVDFVLRRVFVVQDNVAFFSYSPALRSRGNKVSSLVFSSAQSARKRKDSKGKSKAKYFFIHGASLFFGDVAEKFVLVKMGESHCKAGFEAEDDAHPAVAELFFRERFSEIAEYLRDEEKSFWVNGCSFQLRFTRNEPSFAVALNCETGSSCLNAEVNPFCNDHAVRGSNSGYFGLK